MLWIVRKYRALSLPFHLSPPNPCFAPPQPPASPVLHAEENPIVCFLRSFSSQPSSSNSLSSPAPFVRGGFYDSDDPCHCHPSLPLCPGCGIHMQDSDSSLPGFFSLPSAKSPHYHSPISALPLSFFSDFQTSVSLKSGLLQELPENRLGGEDSGAGSRNPLVCARCHSLRHYGRVKLSSAENLLPSFDFDCLIAPKMASPSGPRSVILFVVDAADFEGSFPRKTAQILSSSIERNARAWKESKPANVPRIILVISKLDLLPPSMSSEMIGRWMRQRANDLCAVRLSGLHLVSATKDIGVRKLVEQVADFAGQRGNVWAVGAQNAGKSTLINAMGRCVGRKMAQLTEAPVPGTTLGIVRVEGVLCGQAKLFDTPGILHPYQITTRLTPEEHRLVHIRKELKPRTYRIKAGHSIHIGGLMRLDVEKSSADSIYITVWASSFLPLHMGKKENSYKMIQDHFGRQLQPPIGENRISEIGKWARTEFRVTGDSWEKSSTDITTAGLGWTAICLKGEALLGVWTYDGIDVVSRSSLILERAKLFEEAGFSVSKIVSQADRIFSKEKRIKSVNIQNNKVKPAASSSF